MTTGNSSRAIVPYAIAIALCHCGAQRPAAPPAAAPADNGNPAPSAPEWEAVETGSSCASAQVQCGGGACDAKVKNDCDAALRCALEIEATCSTSTGESTANGSEHGTIAAHSSSDIGAQATCGGGEVVHTAIHKLSCQ